MKITSSHTILINLPELIQLPSEFKFIPATEYHSLVRFHRENGSRKATAIAVRPVNTPTNLKRGALIVELFFVFLFPMLVCCTKGMLARR